jgi:hypothetical protein
MSRPPKLPLKQNPIRQLRFLVGEPMMPLNQTELAEIVDIPLPTLRALESGIRKLSGLSQEKLKFWLGVIWDKRAGQWVVPHDLEIGPEGITRKAGTRPATHADIVTYRALLAQAGRLAPDRDVDALKERIDCLFNQISPGSWIRLLSRIQTSLASLKQQFARSFKDRKKLDEVFRLTERSVYLHPVTQRFQNIYRLKMAKHYGSMVKWTGVSQGGATLEQELQPDGSVITKITGKPAGS